MAIIFMVAGFMIFMPACVHDPTLPIDPGPIDTTGNPIDTTGNPIDTSNNVDTTGVPCDPNVVYFEVQILPILRSNCAKSGCHDAITHQEGIILDSYENVMNADVVRPGRPDNSDLFERITDDDLDDRMPPLPNDQLTNEQINLIRKWIQSGAEDITCNPNYGSCNSTNMSFNGDIVPILNTNCVGCHSGIAPSGGVTLNTYEGVRTVALSGKLSGVISWTPGFPQMPKGAAQKLPDCTIQKINSWINDGAQNN